MEKIKHITDEFKDWILKTLKTGTNPEAIVNAMIKKGFDPIFAYSTLMRITNNQSVSTGESGPYVYETPPIIREGNIIKTSDREIKILMKVDKPFVLYLDNVMSSEECDELIQMSSNRLVPSRVVDPVTGAEKVVSGRTSSGTYYQIQENPLIAKLEKRIAEITKIPVENGEGLQVLHYKIGEEYKAHFDYFPQSKIDSKKGGQRVATLLLYLNDVEAGGETIFPKIGLSISPKKGTALYFHYANSSGQVDRLSLHSSIPVVEGDKWVATKWIREREIEYYQTQPSAGF